MYQGPRSIHLFRPHYDNSRILLTRDCIARSSGVGMLNDLPLLIDGSVQELLLL